MKDKQIHELLYQALETEQGGQKIYSEAIACAHHGELKEEWQKYLEETQNHERILRDIFGTLGLDPQTESPGRKVVRHKGESLVQAMQMAKKDGDAVSAELVAAECVVEAETKDLQNWQLIGRVAQEATGDMRKALSSAFDEVGEQEAEHLYHTQGWAREIWIESLGMDAVLPPPEEEKGVTTQIGAGRAQHAGDRKREG